MFGTGPLGARFFRLSPGAGLVGRAASALPAGSTRVSASLDAPARGAPSVVSGQVFGVGAGRVLALVIGGRIAATTRTYGSRACASKPPWRGAGRRRLRRGMTSPIAVLGPGGVGGLVAAALARAGEPVTVVAREETASAIERDGIRVRSERLGDFVARPAAVAALEDPVGALLVAPKATGLVAALERVRSEPELVVPLLNGLDHMAVLRSRFGERVAAGVIRVESDRPEPGVVVTPRPSCGSTWRPRRRRCARR